MLLINEMCETGQHAVSCGTAYQLSDSSVFLLLLLMVLICIIIEER